MDPSAYTRVFKKTIKEEGGVFSVKVNYHPQSGWLDFKPLKGGEKSKDTSVPVALPQGTTTRGSGFLEDNKFCRTFAPTRMPFEFRYTQAVCRGLRNKPCKGLAKNKIPRPAAVSIGTIRVYFD
jgi:hypothetical protein